VQLLLGGDIFPISGSQCVLSSIGLFLGAVINANIFGELAVILASIGKEEKKFQCLFASFKTVMINLKLPIGDA
jgi:hypothetical protein